MTDHPMVVLPNVYRDSETWKMGSLWPYWFSIVKIVLKLCFVFQAFYYYFFFNFLKDVDCRNECYIIQQSFPVREVRK